MTKITLHFLEFKTPNTLKICFMILKTCSNMNPETQDSLFRNPKPRFSKPEKSFRPAETIFGGLNHV